MQAIATPSGPSCTEVAGIAAGLKQRAPRESQESLHDFGALLEEGVKCADEGAREDARGVENDPSAGPGTHKQPGKELRSCEKAGQEANEDESKVAEEELDGAQDDETTAAEEVEPTSSEEGPAQETEQDENIGVEQNETSMGDDAALTSEGDGVVNQTDGRGPIVEDATANPAEASPASVGATVPTGDVARENTAPESPAPSNQATGEAARLAELPADAEVTTVEAKADKESADPSDGGAERLSRQDQARENPSREDAMADEARRPAENAALDERPGLATTRTEVQRDDSDTEAEPTLALRRNALAPEEAEPSPLELTPSWGDSAQRFAYGRTQTPFGERIASLARQTHYEGRPESITPAMGAHGSESAEAASLRSAVTVAGGRDLNAPRFIEDMLRQTQLMNRPDGSAEIRLRLEPPELGSVLVRLTLHRDRLHAELEVESPAARQMIGSTVQRLREALSGEGIDLEKLDIGLRRQPNGQPDRGAHQQSSQRGDGFDSDTAAEPDGPRRGIHALRVAALSAAGMIDFVA